MPIKDNRLARMMAAFRRRPVTLRANQTEAAMAGVLADNALDLITRHAPDGRIRFASPAARTLLGCAPGSLEGMTPAELVHPHELAAVQAVFAQASYFGRAGEVQARLLHADGHYVWTELRCQRTDFASAGGGDIVAVTRDITAHKAQAQALIEACDAAQAASHAKSRFLANMSHELRTPLNAIIGFSEVMGHGLFGELSPRYREYAGLIQESGNHLLSLINGILDMSKIEAGKYDLHEEMFSLEEAAASAAHVVAMAAQRNGVALSVRVAKSARQAFADNRAVKQILVNLLSNGVKFTPRGGRVALEAAAHGGAVVIAVSDTGTGIAPADLERLGQPFEQVENAQTRAKEGTGLGLALVKALATMHGGGMQIASKLGEGTTVMVRLPHAAVDMEAQATAAPADAKVLPFRVAS